MMTKRIPVMSWCMLISQSMRCPSSETSTGRPMPMPGWGLASDRGDRRDSAAAPSAATAGGSLPALIRCHSASLRTCSDRSDNFEGQPAGWGLPHPRQVRPRLLLAACRGDFGLSPVASMRAKDRVDDARHHEGQQEKHAERDALAGPPPERAAQYGQAGAAAGASHAPSAAAAAVDRIRSA